MNKRLAIIGAGELGQQIAYHAKSSNYIPIGFFDDFQAKGSKIYNLPILGNISEVENQFNKNKFDYLMIGIGYKHMEIRKVLFESYKNKIPFANIIHSTAFIDPSVKLGEGIFIYPGVLIHFNSIIEDNVLINIGSVIAHDIIIKSHCFISPRVAIAGYTTINKCCVLGINCTIIDNINIVEKTQIGAGAVVIKHIENPGLYVGNPAVLVRKYTSNN